MYLNLPTRAARPFLQYQMVCLAAGPARTSPTDLFLCADRYKYLISVQRTNVDLDHHYPKAGFYLVLKRIVSIFKCLF